MLKPLGDASDRSLSGIALVRIDVNASDDWRLMAVLPTIEYVAERARKTVLISHKGRPKPGQRLGKLSLQSDADKLASLTEREVWFVPYTTVPDVRLALQNVPDGAIAVLENIRAFKGEEAGSETFARSLASLGDYFVSDAFPVLHHAAASVTGLPRLMPSYAGFQLVEEINQLDALSGAKRPYVVVIGGAKAKDKLGVLEQCLERADWVLVGGASANALLALSGVNVGSSLYERDEKLLGELRQYVGHRKIVLPVDFVKSGGKILDIGPKTARLFAQKIAGARTVLWTGPLGMIEKARFAKGSLAVAKAIAKNKKAFTVTGGGETISFLKDHQLDRGFSFLSTGGGAMIDFVSGETLPGIVALSGRKAAAKAAPKKAAAKKAAPKTLKKAVRSALEEVRTPKLAPAYDVMFHDDFDGYASAAVFTDFLRSKKSKVGRYVALEYGDHFTKTWPHKDGLSRYVGEKKLNPAVVVDFQFHPQAAFWYDHHTTAFLLPEWKRAFQGDSAHVLEESYASGCRVVLEALMRSYGYQPTDAIRELVRWADVIDGARYANAFQTIAIREAALQVNAVLGPLRRAITAHDAPRPEPLPWLVELLATKPLSAVAKDKRVSERVEAIREQSKDSVTHYRRFSMVKGSVVVTDVTDLKTRKLRFAPYYIAPNAVFGITVDRINGGFKASVSASPWKRERNPFNIGAMLVPYGGGGHANVGSVAAPTRAEIDRLVDHFVGLFNGAA